MRGVDNASVVILSWWDLVSEGVLDEIFAEVDFPGWEMEHAAITETSLMQYFAPELVRGDKIIDDQPERVPKYSIFPPPDEIMTKSGVFYKATSASPEKGEILANHLKEKILQLACREFEL